MEKKAKKKAAPVRHLKSLKETQPAEAQPTERQDGKPPLEIKVEEAQPEAPPPPKSYNFVNDDVRSHPRITLFSRDEHGTIFGVLSLSKESILDMAYHAVKNCIAITLKGITFSGQTHVEPVQNVKVVGREKQKMDSYTIREIYQMEGYNHTIEIFDEGEMRRVWVWSESEKDISFDTLMEMRSDMVKKIEKAREEAKKAADLAAEQENKKSTGLVDATGQPMNK